LRPESSEISPKSLPNGNQKAPKSDSFATPEATFSPILNRIAHFLKKGGPKGAKRDPNGLPKSHHNHKNPHKSDEKHALESGPGKMDEAVLTWDLQKLKI